MAEFFRQNPTPLGVRADLIVTVQDDGALTGHITYSRAHVVAETPFYHGHPGALDDGNDFDGWPLARKDEQRPRPFPGEVIPCIP